MKIKIMLAIFTLAIFLNFSPANAQEVRAEIETPSVWQDIRRSEIVMLGSVPFVTIFTTLGFSINNFIAHDLDAVYAPNPLAKNTAGFSEEEQINILVTSLCISAGVGVADLVVRLVKRNSAKRRAEMKKQDNIEINPVALDITAVKLPPPRKATYGIAIK